MSGSGCPICNAGARLGVEKFIERSKKIHGNTYDYSKVVYNTTHDPVIITCKIHGDFKQMPYKHCNEGQGCPICGQLKVQEISKISQGELLIKNWLETNKVKFTHQFELITKKIARSSNLMIVDFYLKHNNQIYFIEYDGIQHFEYTPHFHKGGKIDFLKQQRRDNVLTEFCELNNIKLIKFNYKMKDVEIINILKSFFLKSI